MLLREARLALVKLKKSELVPQTYALVRLYILISFFD